MSGPLAGIRVLDLSQVVAGPMCAMVLADQGADVIKVEIKGGLDSSRVIGKQPRPDVFTEAASHTMMSRGKRSLVLDMKAVQGKELFFALVKRADVLIQNFRPGAMEKLGLSYEECRKANPDLIYTSLSGFGPVGPYADKPIYDPIIQGTAGVTAGQLDAEGRPSLVQSLVCDKATAITASQAVTAALFARARGQGGQHVQLTMLNTMLQFQWPEQFYNQTFPSSENPDIPEFASIYRLWKCADGKLITMIAVQDKEFFGACNALDLAEYAKDPRFASIMTRGPHFPEILGKVAVQILKFTASEALERLEANDVPCGPVLSRSEIIANPQVAASNALVTSPHPEWGSTLLPRPAAQFSGTPSWTGSAPLAPRLGQHSAEVLRQELGLSTEDVAALMKAGVIVDTSPASKL